MNDVLAKIRADRVAPRSAAEIELGRRGFEDTGDGKWIGPLRLEDRVISVEVQLGAEFPDSLPSILLSNPQGLGTRIPHVDAKGKICVAPSAVLLDVAEPERIIDESLKRASAIVTSGLNGTAYSDFDAEYLAYFAETANGRCRSIVTPSPVAHEIAFALVRTLPSAEGNPLLADSPGQLDRWLANLNAQAGKRARAFWLPLRSTLPLTSGGERTTVKTLIREIKERANPSDIARLRRFLKTLRLPTLLLLGAEIPGQNGTAVVGVTVPAPTGEDRRMAERGFRPKSVRAIHEVRVTLSKEAGHIHVDRLDAPYLLARAGEKIGLTRYKVVLVGVGAVGSSIAMELSRSGIGELHLVDPETVDPENVHRHLLGVAEVGQHKAKAVAERLNRAYPHLTCIGHPTDFESTLAHDSDLLLGADAVVFATGDHNLERRFDQALLKSHPRVFCWVEPAGGAGHSLALDPRFGPGCLSCLYRRDSNLGLINRASIAAHDAETHATLAGCAGVFSPFEPYDAVRCGLESARLVRGLLSGELRYNSLLTWRSLTIAPSEGVRRARSPRSNVVVDGATVLEPAFVRVDCDVCR